MVDTYVNRFNQSDDELYVQHIPNSSAAEFLKSNIPLFECPDKQLEETYYFRWWTFRKHIKQTPEGFVITEFLPDVSWAGKYNAISCPAMFHYNEGRWLHHSQYLDDYAYYWLRGGGDVRKYSFPVAYSLYNQYLVTGNDSVINDLLPDLIRNFAGWEAERWDSTRGLFWQRDVMDGMERSICGRTTPTAPGNSPLCHGYRATINSYMAADARAIARIAGKNRHPDAGRFIQKGESIRENMFRTLWDEQADFLKVFPKDDATVCDARELHGYTPWCFNLADARYAVAWKFLMDTTYFFAPYGPTTAERCHPDFRILYEGHPCQWNGPSWPFATSVTLTGMANLLHNQQQSYISKNDYLRLLQIYARSHHLVKDDGSVVPWIDENLNPFTGDWISRTMLKGSLPKERGKDYNHSSFCDLVITGLVGLCPQEGDTLVVSPLVPEGAWDYFCLDNVLYHGKILTILYDKTGEKYRCGKGLTVFVDGRKKVSSPKLSTIKCII